MSLILDKISYYYGKGTAFESKALKNISLSIPDGEFIGLIGHTGSGKSTLIQHMNGLIKADSGSVYYNGQDIYDKDFKMTELRRKVGLVFQYPEHQLFESTVIKDVLFGPKNIGLSQLEAEVAAYGALRAVGLPDDLIDASPFELSGGQKRRVAIAGVLAMSPEILILDEPTAGLDPAGRTEILSLLKSIKDEKGITIILVSHSMEDVAEFAERIIVIDDGEIKFDDEPREVFKHAAELRKMGLEIPQCTELMNRLADAGLNVDRSCLTTEEAVASIMNCLGRTGSD
ncbi:MAG: energy-coupling factor transporter ATPase [Lachnospiraceae bacterium]|nr:energy-coupling factor transporter ATPase [Lachnospiraceae bacterium]MBR3579487.1 energy-coupling factor transporter ATPase [Lachnospiraceae bacterium]MBR4541148.1 energy-coupling factor transporter ATPase [Lachnospiraceae bacterium]